MDFKKIDFFSPWIVTLMISIFLIMGYIGSFNYRFEDPLDTNVILTIIFAMFVFLIGAFLVKYCLSIEKTEEIPKISLIIDRIFSEKILVGIVIIAILLQCLNLFLMGGIPLFNSVLKSNATTDLWRVAYLLFLPFINILIAKYYKKRYLILVLIGALLFGLNGYRTSLIGILGSVFITLYYLDKISRKIGASFVLLILIGGIGIGFIASQSIANQHWMLNPIELVFYRAAFTLEVFERIIPLAGTTNGHILSMIFSSASPRTFIGNYVLTDNVCLTSTLFGPIMLDYGYVGLTIQMFLLGLILKLINQLSKINKGITIAIYSIVLAHTLIWIETGPTDIMIWLLYLIGIIVILINHKSIHLKK